MHAPKVSTILAATTQAVAAADEAYLHDAIETVSWERRGLLQRLTRQDRHASLRFEPVLEVPGVIYGAASG